MSAVSPEVTQTEEEVPAIGSSPDALSERQREVLDVTLELLIENAAALTMIAVARRANCSKETLYKWFGDRDGLLAATVRYQASKVRVQPFEAGTMNRAKLAEVLEGFARGLLTILTSDMSVALNRLAVSQAEAKSGAPLGQIVLQNGRFSTGPRLKPAIEAGMRARVLKDLDPEEAFRDFYGLTIRDTQIRILLGDDLRLSPKDIEAEAKRATAQFFTLYAASAA
ncbi:MAG: TetR/AcrR family transcriptional regulator C-terminal domain-containing protein [Pseudomonadota bacterium]